MQTAIIETPKGNFIDGAIATSIPKMNLSSVFAGPVVIPFSFGGTDVRSHASLLKSQIGGKRKKLK